MAYKNYYHSLSYSLFPTLATAGHGWPRLSNLKPFKAIYGHLMPRPRVAIYGYQWQRGPPCWEHARTRCGSFAYETKFEPKLELN